MSGYSHRLEPALSSNSSHPNVELVANKWKRNGEDLLQKEGFYSVSTERFNAVKKFLGANSFRDGEGNYWIYPSLLL